MMEVLRTDYIKFARARGLSNRRIHLGHALRNALIPIVTVSGIHLGSTIAFAIVTESLFQWPGVGALLLDAINAADIPVMSAYLLLVAGLFVVINLAVDLVYFAVDPRMRSEIDAKAA
jgi:peptide/nickel transport system permease protein